MSALDQLLNKIHCGDCKDIIPIIPDESIDLLITSPPYDVDMDYDEYNDNLNYEDYIKWLESIFTSLKSKMVSGGRLCINIGDGKNGSIPTHSDITHFMTKRIGYQIKTTIVWVKNHIRNRAAWGSWKSPVNPSFPTPFEYILVFCKDTQHKNGKRENITVSGEEFKRNSLALWSIKAESKMRKYGHSAMFPLEVPTRLIQQLSYKGDVVLDIFSGVGTTCLAAAQLEREWIGIELSKQYVEESVRRINQYLDQTRLNF